MTEMQHFDAAMDTVLKADPQAVRTSLEADKKAREEQRKAKRSSADPASSGKG